ncbi:MAG: WGxxGxxG-CTERM domain-containing protein [Chloroflexota bacterium]|nr:WGxxGxxG-CTERM domain-containing protein [Chloroflexota bacterium]
MKKVTSLLIAFALALLLSGAVVQAQDTDTDAVDPPAAQVDEVVEDEGGFDDWGLLGLLGLLGLAGLRRQPDRVVTPTVPRTDRIDEVRTDIR